MHPMLDVVEHRQIQNMLERRGHSNRALVQAQTQNQGVARGGQSGPLTGQNLFTAINRNQALLDLPPFVYPPERPAFDANPDEFRILPLSAKTAPALAELEGIQSPAAAAGQNQTPRRKPQ